MIKKKYQRLVFAFYMSSLMSGVMSLVISLINLGLIDGFVLAWARVWLVSFMTSYPIVVIITPTVHKLVNLTLSEH